MSQLSVTSFFNSRKRPGDAEIRNKSKVILLDRGAIGAVRSSSAVETNIDATSTTTTKKPIVVPVKTPWDDAPCDATPNDTVKLDKAAPKIVRRTRAVRGKKSSSQAGQIDIRESFGKVNSAEGSTPSGGVVVPFEKMGMLSPKKKLRADVAATSEKINGEDSAVGSTTPKKHVDFSMRVSPQNNLSLVEIKKRIIKSSRLEELKASIARLKKCDEKIQGLEMKKVSASVDEPRIQKFRSIELEVPISPSKLARSPSKSLTSPTKGTIRLPESASPQRRLLFAPKESPVSPVKGGVAKRPAYQRYQTLVDCGTPALSLPYDYRFLAEAFRSVDTIASIMFKRKEVITWSKLRPAVQELLRRNFTVEHLAQIKTIYPEGYTYRQEKLKKSGSDFKQDKYELVLTLNLDGKNEKNAAVDSSNDLGMTLEENITGPSFFLNRRRKFYTSLLDRVKAEHEKFLLSLENPMHIPKEKITRWHPEFDVENCKPIELGILPEAPNVEKAHSAKDVLERAKVIFNCNTRMENALKRLADTKRETSESETELSTNAPTSVDRIENHPMDNAKRIEISIVDTPPTTPTSSTTPAYVNPAFKGIPKALLERVRAKQAAKALEAMTRRPTADREAALYSRLPEMAKILRNIFVVEKKGVLPLETVMVKLDNSYRTKLTTNELEEHIRLICKTLPAFACLQKVRQIDYLKLAKTADIVKVVKALETIANDKAKL